MQIIFVFIVTELEDKLLLIGGASRYNGFDLKGVVFNFLLKVSILRAFFCAFGHD